MNIVKTWENKVKTLVKKLHENVDYDHELYAVAMAYCDCINDFTNDKDKWDCYDRLMVETLKELGVETDINAA